MDKIAINPRVYMFLLSFFLIFTVSCSSINMVAIKNNTDEKILFHGEFVHIPNDKYYMDFSLKPGGNNLWEYEADTFNGNTLDKGLKSMTLTNERKCTIVLTRDTIEKIAKKQGPWIITITKDMMKCK